MQIGAVSLEETERAHSTQKACWAEPFLRYGRPKFHMPDLAEGHLAFHFLEDAQLTEEKINGLCLTLLWWGRVNFFWVPTFKRKFRIPGDTYALRGQAERLSFPRASPPDSLTNSPSACWLLGLPFLSTQPAFCFAGRVGA